MQIQLAAALLGVDETTKCAGEVALITGGGRGIGRHIATGLANAGADLILTSRKTENLKNDRV